jgi:hypothetical protein
MARDLGPPRIVIGAGRQDRVPAKVCEWSIRAQHDHAWPRRARILHTYHRRLPAWSGTWTAFSLVRFWVPELFERRGRAIYLDSDMLLFADIRGLWDLPMEGKVVLSHRDPSVLVIDCAKAARHWRVDRIVDDLRAGRIGYGELMTTMNQMPAELVGEIPDEWNHFDRFEPGRTKLLHYTKVRSQPWRCGTHPLGRLWYQALRAALRTGTLPRDWLDDLPRAIAGRIRRASGSPT